MFPHTEVTAVYNKILTSLLFLQVYSFRTIYKRNLELDGKLKQQDYAIIILQKKKLKLQIEELKYWKTVRQAMVMN